MRVRTAGAVLLAVAALAACGDETKDENAGSAAGAAIGGGSSTEESTTDDAATEAPEAEGGTSSDGPEPSPSTECSDPEGAPEIPAESPSPTMAGDMPAGEVPNGLGGEMVPQFGELIVDVEPQGCIDIATQFQANQRVLMHSFADDGKYTDIRVYGPDGNLVADWETGEPGSVEGWDFFNDAPMPASGTYVFRIIHRDGSDDPFVISFYGQP